MPAPATRSETACEKAVFARRKARPPPLPIWTPVIKLLSEAAALARQGDGSILAALAATRRAVALDRYGVAAQVLATRDGCTAAKCAAFALVDDADVLKSNLQAQVYDQYVSRYAGSWNEIAPVAKPPRGGAKRGRAADAPAVAAAALRRSTLRGAESTPRRRVSKTGGGISPPPPPFRRSAS